MGTQPCLPIVQHCKTQKLRACTPLATGSRRRMRITYDNSCFDGTPLGGLFCPCRSSLALSPFRPNTKDKVRPAGQPPRPPDGKLNAYLYPDRWRAEQRHMRCLHRSRNATQRVATWYCLTASFWLGCFIGRER